MRKVDDMNTHELVLKQREYYEDGKTQSAEERVYYLRRLKSTILKYEKEINSALKGDLNKHPFETKMTETGMVIEELNYFIKNTRRFARNKRVKTPVAHFCSKSYIHPEPYGVVLIMSPWNYPFQLAIEPLIGALAAGNCAILKPSAYAKNTSSLVKKIIEEVFLSDYVAVIEGGRAENEELLNEKFDYIFFTGSKAVGKYVMKCASEKLTPVSLELGGKSPVIIDETANIKLAAKRIAWGKCLNAGQTCVAPDYILIDKRVKEQFIDEYIKIINLFYENENYSYFPRIINDKHFQRVRALIDDDKVIMGGAVKAEELFIEPTLMDNVAWDDAIMKEEIFGPILPVLTYDALDQAIKMIVERPRPLALYLFTSDNSVKKRVVSRINFGGGCINDTIIHLATSHMGFGGIGESGMGSYHGKSSFDTFTHYKSIVDKSTYIDVPVRYAPYTKRKKKILDKLM